jgi:hypothetical protein
MTTSNLNGQLITRVRSARSGAVGVAEPCASAAALKRLHDGFAMSGCDTNVWPLSPEDWLTG